MSINATLFGQMIVFAILIWFSMKFIWPPLMNAIEERQQKIAAGLAAADRARQELADADARVAEELRDARGKATEIIDQAHARANQIIDEARQEAIAEANRQKAAAETAIAAAATRVREDLRRHVSALAVSGAEKLIRREIDAGTHQALLDELAAEI